MICAKKCPADAIDGRQEPDPRDRPGEVHEVRHLLRGLPRRFARGEEDLRRARSASPPRRRENRRQKEQRDMSEILLQIDGREVEAREGMTVLEAAQQVGIDIPTLCHHEKLEPYGGCRLCTVEVEVRGWPRLVAACVYPVEEGLVVRTRSEKIDRIRKMILELLLAHAPDSLELLELGQAVRRGQGPLREGSLLLHPLRPVRPVLRRGQEGERRRLHRPGSAAGDQLHPRDRRQGVLELQGVLPALPDLGAPGRVRAGRSARLRARGPRGRIGLLDLAVLMALAGGVPATRSSAA